MLRQSLSLLRGPAQAPARAVQVVPARRWNQCTMFLCVPPRNPMSLGEGVMHAAFMLVVWIAPMLTLMSQITVWRAKYLGKE